jgi:hypothetical protein
MDGAPGVLLLWSISLGMTRRQKPRGQRLILGLVAVFAILVLLLRLAIFVHGRR